MKNIEDLRDRAKKARRLARGVTDRETHDRLLALADEYEAEADAMEARPKGRR